MFDSTSTTLSAGNCSKMPEKMRLHATGSACDPALAAPVMPRNDSSWVSGHFMPGRDGHEAPDVHGDGQAHLLDQRPERRVLRLRVESPVRERGDHDAAVAERDSIAAPRRSRRRRRSSARCPGRSTGLLLRRRTRRATRCTRARRRAAAHAPPRRGARPTRSPTGRAPGPRCRRHRGRRAAPSARTSRGGSRSSAALRGGTAGS